MAISEITTLTEGSYRKRAIPFLFAIALSLLVSHKLSDGAPLPLSPKSVRESIDRSADYLLRISQKNGRFEYRTNTDPDVEAKSRYNILRHAGAIYAMAMHYRMQPEDKMHDTILLAGQYLKAVAMQAPPEKEGLLAIWSKPDVEKSGKPVQAKLGGTGLGLVALLSIERVSPGFTSMEDLRKLGRFILFMQKKDGSFYSKFVPSEGGLRDDWESLYYPGEAALGMVMLYERDPDTVWLHPAVQALSHLARKRQNSKEIPADHWALIATQRLLGVQYNDLPRELLRRHAWQIAESILKEQITKAGSLLFGGFDSDGRITPAATRLEGLLAAHAIFSGDKEKAAQIMATVRRGIPFLLNAQISEGKYSGAFPRAVAKKDSVFVGAGKFNRRATEVRIDYVQHAMSALIQFHQISF